MNIDKIYKNGKIQGSGNFGKGHTAVAIQSGKFCQFGSDNEILKLKNDKTEVIDLKGKTVIPGLNDSHTHLIRGGLNFNMELRWDGVKSLADALYMLKDQARRTPPPQWVRVVGGWSEFQFKEKRMPTLDEINAVSEDTPVFILHLYDRAFLNKAALNAIGYDKNTKPMPGTEIQRDSEGNPTGMLIAKPNAIILYSSLAMGPKLPFEYQVNSSRQFMRELNRLGVTSVIDAGGGFQNYPEDYEVIQHLESKNQLTVRVAYNLFTQKPKDELSDFKRWTGMVSYQQGTDYLRHNGAGEMLVFSAVDFEDFVQPRPNLPDSMEQELEPVIRHLVNNKWPFRIHATYDESISRVLDVYEKINQSDSFGDLHWIIDHAETISEKSIERIKKLGGGIAVQHRMAFQGEYFIEQYGKEKAAQTPPIRKMLDMGVPVGLGTDATRVASYNPWVALYWLTSGKTIGGTQLYGDENILSREEALDLWTNGSSWFSNEQGKKGKFEAGQLADFAVLSKDYFSVKDEEIKELYSVMTVVGGEIVHGSDEFKDKAPELPAPTPDWSPISHYGTYGAPKFKSAAMREIKHFMSKTCVVHRNSHKGHNHGFADSLGFGGCSCWAF